MLAAWKAICTFGSYFCILNTTLAATFLQILLALTAKFDFEMLQLDTVNAFVHAELLDKTIFMQMPPGYLKQKKVLKLNKAFYGLQRSPIPW